jgi:aryl-phospho-beta-D-glucosidase BglC (GH1 family)
MTTKNTNEEIIFKSRKDFRTFVAKDGKEMIEEIIGSKVQILSVSETSLDEQPDILAVANIHEKTIIECDLKQNIKTLANLLMHTAAYKAKHIIWCINQETPEAMETAHMLSRFNQHEVKLYVVKAYYENHEIKLKALIKPDPNLYQKRDYQWRNLILNSV